MALHLITGYAGTEHITSADQGAYNMGTFGEGEFVLDRGNKLGATVVTNNSITIADGEALMQGRFIKLPVGTTESVTIDNGTSGMKRKDLIVLRYSKDAGTGIESVALAVKKGTPDASTPSDPAVTTGTITDGTDLVNEMPLYRVNLDGLNIASIDTMFSVKTTMVEYMDEYQLPVADADTLGGVKVGTNITRASDGKISIPDGSASAKGVLKVGSGLSVSSGVVSVPDGTTSTKGILKVGNGLSVSSGSVSVNAGTGLNASGSTVYLKEASSSERGGVKIDSHTGLSLSSYGVLKTTSVYEEYPFTLTLTLPSGWSYQSQIKSSYTDSYGHHAFITIACLDTTGSYNASNVIGFGIVIPGFGAWIYNPSSSSKTMKKYWGFGFFDDKYHT